ncbi:hypothetical protein ABEB36_014954 [Hypothenemus hampei]|uniref:NTF2-related export protein n=1 Tax=Hypothenemus hampei TaxID=57062 RepID=A0ABD1E1C6_HYPHA
MSDLGNTLEKYITLIKTKIKKKKNRKPITLTTLNPIMLNIYCRISFMIFKRIQLQGVPKIIEKFNSLKFQKINRIITAVDSQPMFDGGVLINVLGRLQTDEDLPHAYMQTFVLKPIEGSFVVQHIFRLVLYDTI